MQDTIWQRIASTSWFEYALYSYLLYLAWKATKPHAVKISAYAFSALFLLLFAGCLILLAPGFIDFMLIALFTATATGYLIGLVQYLLLKVPAIRHQKKLQLSGTWVWLVILMFCIGMRFYRVQPVTAPTAFTDPQYLLPMIVLMGLFSGIYLGHYRYAKRCMKAGPFTTT